MSTQQAAEQLLEVIRNRTPLQQENGEERNGHKTDKLHKTVVDENVLCIAAARVGSDDQKLVACTLQNLKDVDMGKPLHSLVIASMLHPLEKDFIKTYALDSLQF